MVATIIPTDVAGIVAEQLNGPVDDVKAVPHKRPDRVYHAVWQSSDGPMPIVIRFYQGLRGDEEARHESAALRELLPLGYPVPDVYACVDQSKTYGAPFLVTQRFNGRTLAETGEAAAWVDHACNLLLRLHSLPWQDGFDLFQPPMSPLDFAERQVKWWGREAQKCGMTEAMPGFDWLKANLFRARECATRSLVHRHFQPSNLIAGKTQLVGVVAWAELCIADPAVDVAWLRMTLDTEVGAEVGEHFYHTYQRHTPSVNATEQFWEVFAACKRLTMMAMERKAAGNESGESDSGLEAFYDRAADAVQHFMAERLVYDD